MVEILGGAMMAAGGGMLSASSFGLARMQRRWRSAREFGAGLANAMTDTTVAPIPADEQALLAQLS